MVALYLSYNPEYQNQQNLQVRKQTLPHQNNFNGAANGLDHHHHRGSIITKIFGLKKSHMAMLGNKFYLTTNEKDNR
jgi:hypothetical protein